MTERSSARVGSPCGADSWTSDVEYNHRFHGERCEWEGDEASSAFIPPLASPHLGTALDGVRSQPSDS
jgi:hypothetical protein